jgi:single-strand DNA-binding protein
MKNISRNLVQLIGHLGTDVQLMELANGNKKASMSMAVNNSYTTSSGQTKKDTSWFNLVAWGKSAEKMVETLKKGMEIGIEGRVSNRKYTDKNGAVKYIFEIVVTDFSVMDKIEKQVVASVE